MATVRCPACAARLELGDEHLGREVDCGACGAVFVARPDAPPPRDEADEPRPRRRRRYDEDDEDDRPRRRRRPRYTRADAEAAVVKPATGLIVTGWCGAALALLVGSGLLGVGVSQADAPKPHDRETAVLLAVYGVVGLAGVPYFAAMAVGGHQMRRLKGAGWGYLAAILGIASIVLCTCYPASWAGLPYGIWALVALNRPEVREFAGRADSARDDDRAGDRD